MYYLKGSKHLYLIDYNDHRSLPVWANDKNQAIKSPDYKLMCQLQSFLQQTCGADCQLAWE